MVFIEVRDSEGMFLVGVDDAGRGPIIGPMILAGVKIKAEDEHKLKELGCKDSKLLSREKRDAMFENIKKIAVETSIQVVPVEEIDRALTDGKTNLNGLESNYFAKVINTLQPDKVVIDCPSPNLKAYHAELLRKLNCKPEVSCEHKADFNHVVVAAASILAKVTRDREVDKLKEEIGLDFGSGYLTDEKTTTFMKDHWQNHTKIFRKTWAPYKELMNTKKQKSLGEF